MHQQCTWGGMVQSSRQLNTVPAIAMHVRGPNQANAQTQTFKTIAVKQPQLMSKAYFLVHAAADV